MLVLNMRARVCVCVCLHVEIENLEKIRIVANPLQSSTTGSRQQYHAPEAVWQIFG